MFCFSTIDCVVFCCRAVRWFTLLFEYDRWCGLLFLQYASFSFVFKHQLCVLFSACVTEGAAFFSTACGSTFHFSTTSGTAASALKMGQPFIVSITDDVGFCPG
jgi:hypothetical protein